MYPEYRLNPENIVFVDSIEQHQRVDRMVAGNKAIFKDLIDR
nr:MAG TPA: GHH GHH signature containing HNH/Endo VII superfamily nuclease toxin [Caudoviricetes sp.]